MAPPKIVQDEDEFADLVKSASVTVVDFYASWCGACKKFMPDYEEFAQNYGDVQFLKCDVDEGDGNDIAGEAGVNGLPYLVFYQAGKKIKNLAATSVTKTHVQAAFDELKLAPAAGAAPTPAPQSAAPAGPPKKVKVPVVTGVDYFEVTDPNSGNLLAFWLDAQAKMINYTVGGEERPPFKNAVSDGKERLVFPDIKKGAQLPKQNLHLYLGTLLAFIKACGGEAKDFPAEVAL